MTLVSSMHSPLITIIMPVYNGLRHLPQTLDAVAAQRDVPLQCLAVDDGSDDGSLELLKRRGAWQLLQTDRQGPNRARALALQAAEGEFVTFLDQDDLWHPQHLVLCVQSLERDSRAAAVVAPRRAFRGSDRVRLGGARSGPRCLDPWAIHPINVIDTPSMVVIRRQPLLAAGGWPSDRLLGADTLLWWRLSHAAPLTIAPRRTVGVRRSDGSVSATQRRWPLRYLASLRVAAEDALAAIPHDTRQARRTFFNALLDAIQEIVESLFEPRPLEPGASKLEHLLAAESLPMRVAAIGFLGWLLSPTLRSENAQRGSEPVRDLLENWPAEARITAHGIRRLVAVHAEPQRLASLLCSTKRSASKLLCLLESTLFRLSAAGGRIDDPLNFDFGMRRELLP
jgi:glycosyltransferase involved in cell wall biosynthesis